MPLSLFLSMLAARGSAAGAHGATRGALTHEEGQEPSRKTDASDVGEGRSREGGERQIDDEAEDADDEREKSDDSHGNLLSFLMIRL